MDGVYMHVAEWTLAEEKIAEEARQRFGILQDPILRGASFDEFPRRGRVKTRTEKNREKRRRRGRK